MSKTVFLGLTLALAFIPFSLPAFSQAMAESVLLGAGSSSATVSAGSALNSSLNRSSKQLAGGVQQQVSRPLQTKAPPSGKHLLPNTPSTGTAARQAAQPGGWTVSIKGAKHNCTLTNEQISTAQGTASAEARPTKCSMPNPLVKPESQKYKSVVTVTFPN